jgi:hypothetical protein
VFPGVETGLAAGERRTVRPRRSAARNALLAAWLLTLAVSIAVAAAPLATHATPPTGAAPRSLARARHSQLPLALQEAASAALGASAGSYRVGAAGADFEALNAAQALRTRFTALGAEITAGSTHVEMRLAEVSYGSALLPLAGSRPHARANRVSYAHGALSEWYVNGPLGLEQGFTIAHTTARGAGGPLTLSIALTGDVHASLARDGLSATLRHPGGPSLRYTGLLATDARGRPLSGWLALRPGGLLLRVDTHGATFPLRIDPLLQQGEKLTGGGEVGEGMFGTSVALSRDGNTALIGAPHDDSDVGAAWVFTRVRDTWTQQGAKLTGGGESGRGSFGTSVALSGDGNTAVIGGPADSVGKGAVWVFTRAGSAWTQQGEKLIAGGEGGAGGFGASVALSSDGTTALLGAPFDSGGRGAAWTFTNAGSTWTQQEQELTGAGESGAGEFGSSVALSADATTALIGGEADDDGVGAAWVLTRSASSWSQQGEKLTGGGELGDGRFGYAVALSSAGETALIGGEADDDGIGAAWVFTRSASSWSQQGEKLTGATGVDKGFFGFSVALSSDGSTALIGGQDTNDIGAAWVFRRSHSRWSKGEQLTRSGEVGLGAFGASVALSSGAETALVGGSVDNNFVGAAWAFASLLTPSVEHLHRRAGPASGGRSVRIGGRHLLGATAVEFGTTSATSFIVRSAGSIVAVTPAEPAGRVQVTVITPSGTSASTAGDEYTFTPTVTSVSPNGRDPIQSRDANGDRSRLR